MSRLKIRIFCLTLCVTVCVISVNLVAFASEWAYVGTCNESRNIYTREGSTVEILITGNEKDATLLVNLFIRGLLLDNGSYYPATGLLRTKDWDGKWDSGRGAFSLMSRGQREFPVDGCFLIGDKAPPGTENPAQAPEKSVFVGKWGSTIGVTIVVNADHTGSWVDSRQGQPGTWIGKWEANETRLYLTPDNSSRYGGMVTFTLRADGKMTDPWSNAYFK